jgi:hypothetical protein
MNKTTIREDTAERRSRKYSNPNPIHLIVRGRSFDVLANEIRCLDPAKTLEFGCGESLFSGQSKIRTLFSEKLRLLTYVKTPSNTLRRFIPNINSRMLTFLIGIIQKRNSILLWLHRFWSTYPNRKFSLSGLPRLATSTCY